MHCSIKKEPNDTYCYVSKSFLVFWLADSSAQLTQVAQVDSLLMQDTAQGGAIYGHLLAVQTVFQLGTQHI